MRTFIPAATAGLITALLINVLTTYAPEFEGKIWPVSITHRINYSGENPQFIRITGNSTKVRDCQLVSTEVFAIGDGTNKTLAILQTNSTIVLRPLGATFDWGPWDISLPVYKTDVNIKAITSHRCHPFWITKSVFWEIDIRSKS